MRFQLPRNSLFAILLRSRWWVSIGLAVAVFAVVRLFVREEFAVAVAVPLLLIGIYAAIRQIGRPSPERIAKALERARALPWDGFRAALEEGYRREGMTVARTDRGADLELTRERLVTLVACKRWKVARTGVEPLREFDAATRERGAHARIYVTLGEVTEGARKFAAEKKIRLLGEEELVKLLRF